MYTFISEPGWRPVWLRDTIGKIVNIVEFFLRHSKNRTPQKSWSLLPRFWKTLLPWLSLHLHLLLYFVNNFCFKQKNLLENIQPRNGCQMISVVYSIFMKRNSISSCVWKFTKSTSPFYFIQSTTFSIKERWSLYCVACVKNNVLFMISLDNNYYKIVRNEKGRNPL